MDTRHVVSFSGGKDSTAMLLMMIEHNMPIDRVICIDTTKEFPAMYRHIQRVQKMIEPIQIEIVKMDFDYWFGERVLTKGKMKGKRGFGWPDMRYRWCTQLKKDCAVMQLLGNGKTESGWPSVKGVSQIKDNLIKYLGIAYDEKKRTEAKDKNEPNIRYPLVEWKVTEAEALKYCYSRGLTWEGLYEKFARVSCYCCPMARIGELRTIYYDYPELWIRMRQMDQKSFRTFKPNYTLDDLSRRFEAERRQGKLFD